MKRGSGILMPVFSLPGGHGIGDFGPRAYQFVDMLADHGVLYWQILPLNAGNPENGESPYFSSSAFAINPLLLSLEKVRESGMISDSELEAIPSFPPHRVAYDEVRRNKMPLLETAAGRFSGGAAFEAFCETNRFWLDDFALFDALRRASAKPWPEWPLSLRDRDPRSLDELKHRHAGDIRACKALQFLAFTQWRELRGYCGARGVSTIGDMPIYIAHDSADCWANDDLFKLDTRKRPCAVSGVPPDLFSATGQLWNNPVYDWRIHEAGGFSWWIARMRHLFAQYDIVRIDHFRGLVQYWEVPAGEPTAMNGAWRDAPVYPLFDALTAAITPFPVICEDLGIITDDVRAAMNRYGFPGMKVLQFAFDTDDPAHPYLPHNYNENSIVYTGTHDTMPTLGWLATITPGERDRIEREIGGECGHRKIVWKLIEKALFSKAAIAVTPLQDILGLGAEARINHPAKLHGNWRWRWDPDTCPSMRAFEKLRRLTEKSGRI